MPEINRYTQMPAPLVLNPISFEELSRVPLAKAQAQAEGYGAISRIATDYNVDERDLGYVSNLVQGINEEKDKLVSTITSSGVNSQTVNDVLKLKSLRDNLYNTKIAQAEENKKRIEIWKQQVDQLYAKDSPEYADFMKQKELSGWKGTFADGDMPKTFTGSYGPDYFDTQKDIYDRLKYASEMTELSNVYRPSSGMPHTVESNGQRITYVANEYGKQVLSNEEKLAKAKELIRQEYLDKQTKRGRFKDYVEMTDQELDYQLNAAEESLKQTMSKEHGGGRTIVGSDKIEDQPLPPAYDIEKLRESTYKLVDGIKTRDKGKVSNFFKAYNEVDDMEDNLSPMLYIAKRINKAFKKSRTMSTNSPEESIDLINRFSTVVDHLIQSRELTPAMVYNATNMSGASGDKYRNMVLDKIENFTEKNLSVWEAPAIYTEDYMRTDSGLKRTKIDPVAAAEDLRKGYKNLYTLDKRDVLNPEEGEGKLISEAITKGKMEVQGTIPDLSPDLLDKRGKYIDGMAGARLVKVLDTDNSDVAGKKYYIQQPESTKNTKEWQIMNSRSKTILNLAVGQDADMIVLNENNKPEQIKVMHEFAPNESGKLVPGNFFMYKRTPKGIVKIKLNEHPEWLGRIRSLDYPEW